MSGRDVLGAADVSDVELTQIVADWLGEDVADVELVESSAAVVPYDLDAITTAGRYWVSGTARSPSGLKPFRFFVKHVQSWARSPLFQQVPPEYHVMAEAAVPWYTEPLIYRSDLRSRLPAGLTMPQAVAVKDLDEKSGAIWLEEVPVVSREWTTEELAHAAYLLGRLAASPAVGVLSSIGEQARSWPVRNYVESRLTVQILPMLRDEALWHHPLIATAFDAELRRRLLTAADRVGSFLEEIERVPLGTAHGDACTNNLLVQAGSDDLVLIDYGFWTTQPLGFDLGQLLVGDVQIGRRPASCLWSVENACTPAYVEGLRDEGCDVPSAVVRRGHALMMLLYTGLSALPIEDLPLEPTPERRRIAAERAAMARFILDLVDSTESAKIS
jgi:phosphotransferase family enzyme